MKDCLGFLLQVEMLSHFFFFLSGSHKICLSGYLVCENISSLNYKIGIPVSHFTWGGTIQFRCETYFH